jgi:hypothetical protein
VPLKSSNDNVYNTLSFYRCNVMTSCIHSFVHQLLLT